MTDRLENTLKFLIEKLRSQYPNKIVSGEYQFRNHSGCGFCVSGHHWKNEDLIILECGDTEASPRSTWEDVDTYYLDDMTAEEIFNEIII